jgi:hypothetical protein
MRIAGSGLPPGDDASASLGTYRAPPNLPGAKPILPLQSGLKRPACVGRLVLSCSIKLVQRSFLYALLAAPASVCRPQNLDLLENLVRNALRKAQAAELASEAVSLYEQQQFAEATTRRKESLALAVTGLS